MPRAPDFWWREPGFRARALTPLGAAYGLVAGARLRSSGAASSLPVLCVGNPVAGGAGKTPTAIAVAAACREMGLEPGFLSRGYGGRAGGPLQVSLAGHDAGEVGDEALLLAAHAPAVVARDRPEGARLLAGLGVDVVVMDDGFQNPSLAKDLALLVVDARAGIGNGRVLPAGPLRAPLRRQLRAADALVVLGEGEAAGPVVRAAARSGLPVLTARLEVPVGAARDFAGRRCLAFAGIGHPEKFFATLEKAGALIETAMAFPDHHPFGEAECERILRLADSRGLLPVTTEKDLARLGGRCGAAARLARIALALPVKAVFEEPRRLTHLIEAVLAGRGRKLRSESG